MNKAYTGLSHWTQRKGHYKQLRGTLIGDFVVLHG